MVFHSNLSDNKYPKVSRTLLSIFAVVNNAVLWMSSTRPLTSKSSSPFNKPFITLPKAPITIAIIVMSGDDFWPSSVLQNFGSGYSLVHFPNLPPRRRCLLRCSKLFNNAIIALVDTCTVTRLERIMYNSLSQNLLQLYGQRKYDLWIVVTFCSVVATVTKGCVPWG